MAQPRTQSQGKKSHLQLLEYKFFLCFKADLSQDVHEEPALVSGLSDVSGQAAKEPFSAAEERSEGPS